MIFSAFSGLGGAPRPLAVLRSDRSSQEGAMHDAGCHSQQEFRPIQLPVLMKSVPTYVELYWPAGRHRCRALSSSDPVEAQILKQTGGRLNRSMVHRRSLVLLSELNK